MRYDKDAHVFRHSRLVPHNLQAASSSLTEAVHVGSMWPRVLLHEESRRWLVRLDIESEESVGILIES